MRIFLAVSVALALCGCRPTSGERWQGYLEGEFVHVAAPLAGRVETVDVVRGQRIAAGTPLFTLERAAELAAQREAAERLALRSFDPRSQDQAALYLVDRRGVLEQVDRLGLTREVMAVLAREWASFPSAGGGSAYGQPVKTPDELARFYRDNLASLRG